jgi:hypothetical protein
MAGNINDNYDFQQIIKKVYEQPNVPDAENPNLLRVRNVGGNLVPDIYDEIFLTYVSGGPADGEIATATYYLDSNLIATLNLEYYPDGLLKRVTRT